MTTTTKPGARSGSKNTSKSGGKSGGKSGSKNTGKSGGKSGGKSRSNGVQDGLSPRQRIEEEVADRIIALLDAGGLPPWEKDWRDSAFGLPVNAVSMKAYRGINRWLTLLTQQLMGYNDPRWLTYRQAETLGGHVRKGEESTRIVFWKRVHVKPRADSDGSGDSAEREGIEVINQGESSPGSRTYPMLRAYSVFNVEQTEDCRLKELPAPEAALHDPITLAEEIIRQMPGLPVIQHYSHANHAPHYAPAQDTVRVPDLSRYQSPDGYYTTVFHELVHSTGHPGRLARFDLEANAQDLHAYGREELVAAMGSAMLGAHAGIAPMEIERDASYILHWRDAIQADKAMVIRAATLAQKSADHILGLQPPEFTDEKPQAEPQAEPQAKPQPEPTVNATDVLD